MRIYNVFIALIFTAPLLTGCGEGENDRDVDIMSVEEKTAEEARKNDSLAANSVYAGLTEDENLSRFAGELEAAGLNEEMISENGPVTVFAPSDSAYENNSSDTATTGNASNAPANRNLMEYYMVDGELTADFLRKEAEKGQGEYELQTRQGEKIMVILENDEIVLVDAQGNRATLQDEKIRTGSGVIHTIDEVLQPKNQAVVAENEIEVNND